VAPVITEARNDATALTADEYRASSAFKFAIPSRPNKFVMIRRITLLHLFMADAVPMGLLGQLAKLESLQTAAATNPALLAMMDKATKLQLEAAIDRVLCEAVASPKFTLDRSEVGPGVLHVSEFDFADKLAVFTAAQYPPPIQPGDVIEVPRMESDAAAATFPAREQGETDHPASNGQSLRPEARVVDLPGGGRAEYLSL
jgi:hypothetical protein